MKLLKNMMLLLIFSMVVSVLGVNAAIYNSYVGFSLRTSAMERSMGYVTKQENGAHVLGILSTKNDRDVVVRLYGYGVMGDIGYSPTETIEIPGSRKENGYIAVEDIDAGITDNAYGMFTGNVFMFIRTRNSYPTETYMNGTWYSSIYTYTLLN